MCLFKAYVYVLCGHIDYEVSLPCINFQQDSTSLSFLNLHDDCVPQHPDPDNGVAGNLDQFFVILANEIGPTATWDNTIEEDGNETTPMISGLCGTCTAATQELINMYQTRPYFGLAEEMVLDDAATDVSTASTIIITDDDGHDEDHQDSGLHGNDYNKEAEELFYQRLRYLQLQAGRPMEGVLFDDLGFPLDSNSHINKNEGVTTQQQFAAQIDMHNAWAKDCGANTSNAGCTDPLITHDQSPSSDTTVSWNERNFVENLDLLDDPFAIHGDKSLGLPGTHNDFLTNVMRVMDDDDSNKNNTSHGTRLSRTHTTTLVLRLKKQPQTSDKKRKRSVMFDIPSSTKPPDAAAAAATASSGEVHHQDKKRKISTVPSDCPYALRSRPDVSLQNGL